MARHRGWPLVTLLLGMLLVAACSTAAPSATSTTSLPTSTTATPTTTDGSTSSTSSTTAAPATTTTAAPATTTTSATTSTATPPTTTTAAPTTTSTTTTSTTTTSTTTTSTTTTAAPTTTTAPPTTVTVTMGEFFMDPATVRIPAGSTVRWVNGGTQPHNTVSGSDPSADGQWASPDLLPGASYERTFDTPGTYPYFCSLHPGLMPGTVVVEG